MNSPRILFLHPDGGRIELDINTAQISIIAADGIGASIGVGLLGMIRLAEIVQREGSRWAELLSAQGLI